MVEDSLFQTRITKMLGIKYPILCGGLGYLTRAEIVAAVAEAGGLGFIVSATLDTPEELRQEIRKARALTNKPIGVNINLFPTVRPVQPEDYVKVVLEEKVKVVETSGRSPAKIMPLLKQGGVTVIHKCARVRDAVSAERLGADAVTIVGYECGGHPSLEEVTTLVLVPRVVDSVKVPVIAAGGFTDARGFMAALCLGAEGVLMGTRFMATKECIVHPKVKEWMVQAKETDTAYVQKSIQNPSRVMRNTVAQQVLDMEAHGATLEELLPVISGARSQKAMLTGDLESGLIACGQVVGLIDKIVSVKEVIDSMVQGALLIKQRLADRPAMT